MRYAICTDRGNVKKINQDSALYKEASTGIGKIMLAAVCDGMGGLKNGEIASAMMTSALAAWFDKKIPELMQSGLTDDALKESLNRLIIEQDDRIMEYGEENGDCGTTLSAVIACAGMYLCVNIGDSRVYRIADGLITQLTHDHTVVQQLIEEGKLTREQSETHPDRNILLQCIGSGGDVRPEYSTGEYADGDIFLVCSDGFRHKLTEDEMERVFAGKNNGKELEEAAQRCVAAIKKRKERDNITVISIKM